MEQNRSNASENSSFDIPENFLYLNSKVIAEHIMQLIYLTFYEEMYLKFFYSYCTWKYFACFICLKIA